MLPFLVGKIMAPLTESIVFCCKLVTRVSEMVGVSLDLASTCRHAGSLTDSAGPDNRNLERRGVTVIRDERSERKRQIIRLTNQRRSEDLRHHIGREVDRVRRYAN